MEFFDKVNGSKIGESMQIYHLSSVDQKCKDTLHISHGNNSDIDIMFSISLSVGQTTPTFSLYKIFSYGEQEDNIYEVSDKYNIVHLFIHTTNNSNDVNVI
ncbi:hypothetical protein RF11_11107 [Thelohanellus kitauei]|uniref:Uncharacterized protein n=1 Tax=Thelohanellus kitauei TaxID=669202 RepID=A0A0C2MQB9_THEKT|nr:hypothetical protein RF11_11107 [Thelohanellus kitauei]